MSEHTVVLSMKFLSIHIYYSVTKNPCKIRVCESRVRASECYFHLVFLARPFTHFYPLESPQRLTRSNPLKKFSFETAIVNLNGGYLMNKMNDCLMILHFVALTVNCSCTLTKTSFLLLDY